MLVILLLLTASGRLITTSWTDGLGVVMDFVILGAILGMALGRSQYPSYSGIPYLHCLWRFDHSLAVGRDPESLGQPGMSVCLA